MKTSSRSKKTSAKSKRRVTPKVRAKRERATVISLLVLIGILVALIIALLPEPDGRELPRVADDRPPRSEEGVPSGDSGPISPVQPRPETAPAPEVSERYPVDEPAHGAPEDDGRPDDARPDETRELWWLPVADAGDTAPGPLYLVLDDAGGTLGELRPFLDLPFPMAIAVLPQLPYSIESALAAAAAGKEVLLHQPMQPVGAADPGPGSVGPGMRRDAIREQVLANLDSVPGAIGANNHMGSLATQDPAVMQQVLATLHEQGLFFLDSRTSSKTVARQIAHRVGLPFAERHVFLDNIRDSGAILQSVSVALQKARSGEPVVMIGHVTAGELVEVLSAIYPVLQEHGYRFEPLSRGVSVPRIARRDNQ